MPKSALRTDAIFVIAVANQVSAAGNRGEALLAQRAGRKHGQVSDGSNTLIIPILRISLLAIMNL